LKKNKIICCDFDGTLTTYKSGQFPSIGKPIHKTIKRLLNEKKNGAKIILWTCRCNEHLDDAVEWCRQLGIEFDAVNANLPEAIVINHGNDPRKVYATEYWDDRAINTEDL